MATAGPCCGNLGTRDIAEIAETGNTYHGDAEARRKANPKSLKATPNWDKSAKSLKLG